ncbi:porin [Aquibium sp. LZ166]|uniref:Porin n=1 Tax=Aquibium pacificus TaxID=3153579 RepID=A0ABV3SPS4_9HYPH
MNIKSLLLGSAAVLVAATGAKAADAIVIPEPEPVEYVRVCDAYGAGFFYIPGTETCLQISGYVWYQIGANGYDEDSSAITGGDTTGYIGGSTGDGWLKSTRARVNFDARSDTEWGTLRAFIRLQATWGTQVDGPVSVDQGFIQLGGLMMGYSESFWANSGNGGPSNWGSHSWGGMYYGYQQRHLVGYRFNGSNGFFAAVSLEDDTLSGEGYMPDVVGKIGVSQGWGAVWAKVAYDESFDGSVPTLGGAAALFGLNDGGWAVQLGTQINVPSAPGSSLRVIGYWADGAHAYNVGSPSVIFGPTSESYYGGAEWSILASYNHQFTPTLGASVAFQWFNDLYYATTDASSGVDAWGAELSVVWVPVENFEIRTELHYDDVGTFNVPATPAGFDPDGTVSGFLRFTRYF